jgi:twitching motility protein PilT
VAFTEQNLKTLMQLAVQHHASDIHIRSGETPCLRIRGDLVPVQTKTFKDEDLESISKILIEEPTITKDLDNLKEYDGGYAIPGLCRVRFNFFRYNNRRIGLILRIISEDVPRLKNLGLASALGDISLEKRGLILVTGPTGSGKSTTLAAMINHINETRHSHIVTIEDPVEFMHPQIKSRISQREVGSDTEDFASALRAALRQDPDVILIGEMRDPETVQIALKAAETGHTVFSTVHTTNAITTLGRIISMFSPKEQEDVRKRLAVNLKATVSQRMLKRRDNKGVVIAQEIMRNSPGIRECILGEEPLDRIRDVIKEGHGGGGNGSVTFDQDIMELYQRQVISKETALSAVSSQSDFVQKLEFS